MRKTEPKPVNIFQAIADLGGSEFAGFLAKIPALRRLLPMVVAILVPNNAAMERLYKKLSAMPRTQLARSPKFISLLKNFITIESTTKITSSVFIAASGLEYEGRILRGLEDAKKKSRRVGGIEIIPVDKIFLKHPKEPEEIVEEYNNIQYLEALPYPLFLNVIETGKIEGKDLVSLCLSSPVINLKCDQEFRDSGVNIPQYLFRLLLKREFNLDEPLPGKTARQTYMYYHRGGRECENLVAKIKWWTEEALDTHNIPYGFLPINNIYDLLYASNSFDLSRYILGKDITQLYEYDGDDIEIRRFTPDYIFGEMINLLYEGGLIAKPDIDIEPSEDYDRAFDVTDRNLGVIYDYDKMKEYFETKDDKAFENKYNRLILQDGKHLTIEELKDYPYEFVGILKDKWLSYDRERVRKTITEGLEKLVEGTLDSIATEVIEEGLEVDGLRMAELVNAHRFNDEDIDLLVDLHFRIMDIHDVLNIDSLFTCETITKGLY